MPYVTGELLLLFFLISLTRSEQVKEEGIDTLNKKRLTWCV